MHSSEAGGGLAGGGQRDADVGLDLLRPVLERPLNADRLDVLKADEAEYAAEIGLLEIVGFAGIARPESSRRGPGPA